MKQDQIDPFLKEQVTCNGHQINNWLSSTESRTTQIAQSFAWHLKRLPENKDRKRVLLALSKHICVECGSEKLPCYCAADQ